RLHLPDDHGRPGGTRRRQLGSVRATRRRRPRRGGEHACPRGGDAADLPVGVARRPDSSEARYGYGWRTGGGNRMSGNRSNDTGQISVAELLARNGQKVGTRAGGRRRRGASGGISVAELTGEIPITRADSKVERHTATDAESAAGQADSSTSTAAVEAETPPKAVPAPRKVETPKLETPKAATFALSDIEKTTVTPRVAVGTKTPPVKTGTSTPAVTKTPPAAKTPPTAKTPSGPASKVPTAADAVSKTDTVSKTDAVSKAAAPTEAASKAAPP